MIKYHCRSGNYCFMTARLLFVFLYALSVSSGFIPVSQRQRQRQQQNIIATRRAPPRQHNIIITSMQSQQQQQQQQQQEESSNDYIFNTTVGILERGEHHIVAIKPPAVICHHSDWAGSRSSKMKDEETDVPMLQRLREAVGERVNLVHRLDRGASGCLLFTKASSDDGDGNATAVLQRAMESETSTKTYVALVRGEGILKGRDFMKEGWFEESRPIKDAKGRLNNATTYFRFIAGQDNGRGTIDRPRASIVLCRPKTGRWHQIRRHLNGLSHPILGDTWHGNGKLNREWREKYGMIPERACLHLLKLDIPPISIDDDPNKTSPTDGINIVCPLAHDMLELLQNHLPVVLRDAERILLEEEGLRLRPHADDKTVGEEINVSINLSTSN